MSATAPSAERHQEWLLAAARSGDPVAYERLVEPHRRGLHVHCYRMLGSPHDADDALQDTLFRAWRALPRFGGQKRVRPWLYRIATNACLDLIERRSRRAGALGPGLTTKNGRYENPRPAWVEPYPDDVLAIEDPHAAPSARYEQREAVELAFVAALQHLPPRQRAVLVLRDVLGFSAREVADSLATTVTSVNSALQRARRLVDERLPERSQQATLRALGDEGLRRLVDGFVDAWDRADVDAMVAALTEDVMFTMPPEATRRGADAIAAFLPTGDSGRWRLVPARASCQLAFGAYRWDPRSRCHRAALLDVITVREDRIAEIVAFARPELIARFGLADRLLP